MDAVMPGAATALADPDLLRPEDLYAPISDVSPAIPTASADPPLKWIGMIALGSFVGFAITAAAFLSLTGPERAAPSPPPPPAVEMETAPEPAAAEPAAAEPVAAVLASLVAREEISKDIAAEARLILARRVHAPVQAPPQPLDEEVSNADSVASEPIVQYASGPPAAEGERTHVVGEGETLWSIAAQGSVSPAELASRNGLSPDARVVAGDTVVIPVPR
jgi:LysM repeat protein